MNDRMKKRFTKELIESFEENGNTNEWKQIAEDYEVTLAEAVEAVQESQNAQNNDTPSEPKDAPEAVQPTQGHTDPVAPKIKRARRNGADKEGSLYDLFDLGVTLFKGGFDILQTVIKGTIELFRKYVPVVCNILMAVGTGLKKTALFLKKHGLKHKEDGRLQKGKYGLPKLTTKAKVASGSVLAAYLLAPILWFSATSRDAIVYTAGDKQIITQDQEYTFKGCVLEGVDSLDLENAGNVAKLQTALRQARTNCTASEQQEFEIVKSFAFPKVWDPHDIEFATVPEGNAVCTMKLYDISIRLSWFFSNKYLSKTNVYGGDMFCAQPSMIMNNSLSNVGHEFNEKTVAGTPGYAIEDNVVAATFNQEPIAQKQATFTP